jgi:hypothetical protein
MVTRVTVVTGSQAQGGPEGPWEGSTGSPKGPQEGSQKGSSSGKGCESKGRCSLFLRKRNKIKTKIKVKGS